MGKIWFDVYALELTEENISLIIEKTEPLGWTLYDLKDNLQYNAENGFGTILFMKLFRDTTEIATFTEEEGDAASHSLRLTDELDPKFGIFHKFEKI